MTCAAMRRHAGFALDGSPLFKKSRLERTVTRTVPWTRSRPRTLCGDELPRSKRARPMDAGAPDHPLPLSFPDQEFQKEALCILEALGHVARVQTNSVMPPADCLPLQPPFRSYRHFRSMVREQMRCTHPDKARHGATLVFPQQEVLHSNLRKLSNLLELLRGSITQWCLLPSQTLHHLKSAAVACLQEKFRAEVAMANGERAQTDEGGEAAAARTANLAGRMFALENATPADQLPVPLEEDVDEPLERASSTQLALLPQWNYDHSVEVPGHSWFTSCFSALQPGDGVLVRLVQLDPLGQQGIATATASLEESVVRAYSHVCWKADANEKSGFFNGSCDQFLRTASDDNPMLRTMSIQSEASDDGVGRTCSVRSGCGFDAVEVRQGRLERADAQGLDKVKAANARRGDFSERVFNPSTRIVRIQPGGNSQYARRSAPETIVALHMVLSAPNPDEAARQQHLPANALLRADAWIINENGKRISPVRDLSVMWVAGQLTVLLSVQWDFANKEWSWTRGELVGRLQVAD